MRKRATTGQILGSLGLLAAVALAAVFWWPHIVYSFRIARYGVKIPGVPVTAMKAPGKTADWSSCRLGAMALKLPEDFVNEAERTVEKSEIRLTTPELRVAINVPYRLPAPSPGDLTSLAAELKVSPIRMLEESYRASTDDFRWSMSRSELKRLQVLLSLASMFPHGEGRGAVAIETRFDSSIEGLLIIYDSQHANFEWRTLSGTAAGYVMFGRREGELDLGFVRDVCWSISCDEDRLGPVYGKKELQQMLDAMETTRAP